MPVNSKKEHHWRLTQGGGKWFWGGQSFPFAPLNLNLFKFLDTLLKLETYVGILLHGYWDRNHCIGMSHCHFSIVRIRYNGVLRAGLRNFLPTRNYHTWKIYLDKILTDGLIWTNWRIKYWWKSCMYKYVQLIIKKIIGR